MTTKYYIDNKEVTQSDFEKAVESTFRGLYQVEDVSDENGYHRFFYNYN